MIDSSSFGFPTSVATPRIGVIGCGRRVSGLLSRMRDIDPDLRISAVFDPSDASVASMRVKTGATGAVRCSSPRELCERADVDWVMIGSWNSFHAEQTVLAFEAGKHVFCEKPLALSLEEAEAMYAAWQNSGCMFALGLVLRYSPLYQAVRKILDDGRIGRILSFEFNETLRFNHGGYIHGNWRRLTENAGSHLLEKCCHDLDLALWLIGDHPTRVASFGGCSFFTPENRGSRDKIGPDASGSAAFEAWSDPGRIDPFTADKDIVDNQVGILEFSSGIRATFHTQCLAAIPERRFYILGSEGSIRFDAYTGLVETQRVGWDEPRETIQPVEGDGHAGGDEHLCRGLLNCMKGEEKPAAGFSEGVRSLLVAHAMDTAMAEGRVVDLGPLWERAAPMFANTWVAEETSNPVV